MCEQCRAFDDDDEVDALAYAFLLRQQAGQATTVKPVAAPALPLAATDGERRVAIRRR